MLFISSSSVDLSTDESTGELTHDSLNELIKRFIRPERVIVKQSVHDYRPVDFFNAMFPLEINNRLIKLLVEPFRNIKCLWPIDYFITLTMSWLTH